MFLAMTSPLSFRQNITLRILLGIKGLNKTLSPKTSNLKGIRAKISPHSRMSIRAKNSPLPGLETPERGFQA